MDRIAPFFEAVEAGDVERARVLLAAHPELTRARDAGDPAIAALFAPAAPGA